MRLAIVTQFVNNSRNASSGLTFISMDTKVRIKQSCPEGPIQRVIRPTVWLPTCRFSSPDGPVLASVVHFRALSKFDRTQQCRIDCTTDLVLICIVIANGSVDQTDRRNAKNFGTDNFVIIGLCNASNPLRGFDQ